MDDNRYRVSPAWAARTRFTGADGALHPEPIDLAILMLVAGRMSDNMPAEGGDIDGFVAGMRELRDAGDTVATPFSVHVRASDLSLRLPAFAKSVERLRHLRNRDSLCFSSVELMPDGKGATFTIAAGVATITVHRAFAPRLAWNAESARNGQYRVNVPFADRSYVELKPAIFAGFRSVSSAPVALRLTSWLHARSPEGLPPDHRCEVDEYGRWLIRCTHENVGRTLGITTTRGTLKYYQDLFERIARDLLPLNIAFRAVSEPVHRRATNWRLRFHRVDTFVDPAPSRDDGLDDVENEGGESLEMLQRIVADSRREVDEPSVTPAPSEVFTLMDDEAIDVDAVVAEPVAPVELTEPVAAADPTSRPRVTPRGRMKGIAIDAEPDVVIEPIAASVVLEPEPVSEPLPEDTGSDELTPIVPPDVPVDPSARTFDFRPPWLRRRFVHERENFPRVWFDRAVGTNAELEDALRAGVHVWSHGMAAQPVRLQGLELGEGFAALMATVTRAHQRSDWLSHIEYSNREWTSDDGEYVPTGDDDDPEGHRPADQRTKPRDRNKSSGRPHDGLGFTDDAGVPVHETGKPMDRSRKEKAWDDLVPRITEIV